MYVYTYKRRLRVDSAATGGSVHGPEFGLTKTIQVKHKCIYTYREREIDREREGDISMYVYIYIYT